MRKTADAARGKWKGILQALEIDPKHLTGKHGPCPHCGGNDRFRFDNQRGDGTWICSFCGAGTGFDLLKMVKGWDFKAAADEVDKIIGNVPSDPPSKSPMDDERKRKLLRELFEASSAIRGGDLAWQYLVSRVPGVDLSAIDDLRFHPDCVSPDGNRYPALLAVVRDCATGDGKTIHRTFLTSTGVKAPIERPRALMPVPGDLGAACIRLGACGDVLGIAEGIETALAARTRFDVPCWAAINTTLMAKWEPPKGVHKVIVFGDCDDKFGGQAAAYTLAHRLSRHWQVEVRIPSRLGTDWADEVAA